MTAELIKELAENAREKFPHERTEEEIKAIKEYYHCYCCYAWNKKAYQPCAFVERKVLHFAYTNQIRNRK